MYVCVRVCASAYQTVDISWNSKLFFFLLWWQGCRTKVKEPISLEHLHIV